MSTDYLFISVESRKGGVGKTTAALNLARLLLKKQRAVLLLDADITGTDAVECLVSPFWKDTGHAVRARAEANSGPANLLMLFEKQFMAGLGVPRFVVGDDNGPEKTLSCLPNRINVIGSQIYSRGESLPDSNAKYICNPSVLFDELHAFWFVEFLQELCTAFAAGVHQHSPDHPIAIVIDNSPGYVGIAPAVQEWLTDLGPDRGKFLTITSLDVQDLISCGHAVDNLHALYVGKWKVSQKFGEACPQQVHTAKPFQLNRAEHPFFLRLLESAPHVDATSSKNVKADDLSGNDLAFYHRRGCPAGDVYANHIGKYQAVVINRVPRLVKRGVFSYESDDMLARLHHEGSTSLRSLLDEDERGWSDRMVCYDENIEYQFLQPMLSRREGRMSRRRSHFEEAFFHYVEETHALGPDEPIHDLLRHGERLPLETLDRLREYMRHVHERVAGVIRLLDQYGFSHLTRLIDSEWLPGSILRDIGVAIREIFSEMEFPHVDFVSLEWDTGPVAPEARMFLERLPESVHELLSRHDMPVPMEIIDEFVPSLMGVLGLSLTSPWWHPPFAHKFTELFAAVPLIQARHFVHKEQASPRKGGIQRFLANETVTAKEAREYPLHIPMRSHWHEHNLFPRLYSACSMAQSRLIDLRQDADFLLRLIRELVHEEIKEAPVLPYIRGIAEKVIVRKTVPHDQGLQQVSKGFASAQYMDEFAAVLAKILKQWEE
jgi:hypothetical protein